MILYSYGEGKSPSEFKHFKILKKVTFSYNDYGLWVSTPSTIIIIRG